MCTLYSTAIESGRRSNPSQRCCTAAVFLTGVVPEAKKGITTSFPWAVLSKGFLARLNLYPMNA